ncbi:unnamed protein product [Prunus armeniaca]
MELTKAIRFGHGTENLGNGLLMQVEMWKKMSKVGDIGYDPYEFANVIGMEINPCTLVAAKLLILQGDLLPGGNTLPSSMYEAKKTLSALGTSGSKQRFNLERGCASEDGVVFYAIPSFKRMFQSRKTVKSLTWHAARKSVEGHMPHLGGFLVLETC